MCLFRGVIKQQLQVFYLTSDHPGAGEKITMENCWIMKKTRVLLFSLILITLFSFCLYAH